MTELKDVADEFIDLGELMFPKDKSKCKHIASIDNTFIPIKEGNKLIGCFSKCYCGELIKHECPCAIGAIETDYDVLVDGEPYSYWVFPCDLKENEKFVRGLEKWELTKQ